MKITVVGTGAMYVKDNSACTLINNEVLVDVPNGTVKQLLKKNYDLIKIKTILITHLHGDHTADIPFFLKYIFLNGQTKINIIGPVGLKKNIIEMFKVYNFSVMPELEDCKFINFIEILEDNIITDNYKIDSFLVKHGKSKNCLAYIVDDKLGLTGDACMCDGINKIFEKSKLVICDTSAITGDDHHLGVNDVKKLIQKYNVKIIPTHMRKVTKEYLLQEKIDGIQLVEDFYETEI